MGFRSNDFLTFARVPGLIKGISSLASSVYGRDGLVSNELKRLVSIICSTESGSFYCKAHTFHGAEMAGIDNNKIKNVINYKTSKFFSDSEKAALNIAQLASRIPITVTEPDFKELKKYFNDNQICEIVAVIGLFGFLNRWNILMSTDIEGVPLSSLQEIES